jgi:hypothetical protein
LDFDLAWTRGGVQQVWGLGVPLWRLPFEILAKIVGQPGFPDRLAFGVALALITFSVLEMWLIPFTNSRAQSRNTREPVQSRTSLSGTLTIATLLLLFPPFLNWLRTPLTIYDEVLAYAYVYGLALMLGTIALIRSPSWSRYWFLCALSGFGGLIRPTIAAYGAVTVVIASGWMMYQSIPQSFWIRKLWRLWMGMALFAVGGVLLLVTNQLRFGDGLEFGHRVHVEDSGFSGTMYATRFGDPFAKEPIPSAARELFGSVFLVRDLNGFNLYQKDFFPGQSKTLRWRHFYSTTFDWSFAAFTLLGWVAAIRATWALFSNRRKSTNDNATTTAMAECAAMGLWSLASTALLGVFYLRVCCISSRYIMDFAPAFAAGMLALFLRAVTIFNDQRWTRRVLFGALVCWTVLEVTQWHSMFGGPRSATWNEVARNVQQKRGEIHLPASTYTAGFDFRQTGVPYNGEGWDPSGMTAPVVILFVTDPEMVQVDVSVVGNAPTNVAPFIQGKIGTELLKHERDIKTPEGWRAVFQGPSHETNRRGIQTLFFGFGPKENLAATNTPYRLLRVCWRGSSNSSEPASNP